MKLIKLTKGTGIRGAGYEPGSIVLANNIDVEMLIEANRATIKTIDDVAGETINLNGALLYDFLGVPSGLINILRKHIDNKGKAIVPDLKAVPPLNIARDKELFVYESIILDSANSIDIWSDDLREIVPKISKAEEVLKERPCTI